MRIDGGGAMLERRLDELYQIGAEPGDGAYRPLYGTAWVKAGELVERWMKSVGLETGGERQSERDRHRVAHRHRAARRPARRRTRHRRGTHRRRSADEGSRQTQARARSRRHLRGRRLALPNQLLGIASDRGVDWQR